MNVKFNSAHLETRWSFYPFTNTRLILLRSTATTRSAHEWATGLVASPVVVVDTVSTTSFFPGFAGLRCTSSSGALGLSATNIHNYQQPLNMYTERDL